MLIELFATKIPYFGLIWKEKPNKILPSFDENFCLLNNNFNEWSYGYCVAYLPFNGFILFYAQ